MSNGNTYIIIYNKTRKKIKIECDLMCVLVCCGVFYCVLVGFGVLLEITLRTIFLVLSYFSCVYNQCMSTDFCARMDFCTRSFVPN